MDDHKIHHKRKPSGPKAAMIPIRYHFTLLLSCLLFCHGATAQAPQDLTAALQPLLERAAAQQVRLDIALQELDTETGSAILLGAGAPYHPASTIKMLLITSLMQQVDAGLLSLEDTVAVNAQDIVGGFGVLQHESVPQQVSLGRLAGLTVTISDNTATNVLVDVLGYEPMAQLAQQLDLQVMHFGRKMFEPAQPPLGDNHIDAADALTLLTAIHAGDILSSAAREQILSWMQAQTVRSKFGVGIPDTSVIAHKTGENGPVSHDMGYIMVDGRTVALVVLAESLDTDDFDTAQALLNPLVAEVASTVYHSLFGQ